MNPSAYTNKLAIRGWLGYATLRISLQSSNWNLKCYQYEKPEIRCLCKESAIHPVNPKQIVLAIFCLSDISLGIYKNLSLPPPPIRSFKCVLSNYRILNKKFGQNQPWSCNGACSYCFKFLQLCSVSLLRNSLIAKEKIDKQWSYLQLLKGLWLLKSESISIPHQI